MPMRGPYTSLANVFAVGLVDQTQHSGRMRVIDELVRHESVQQRFDGRIGCDWIEEVGALDRHHVFVGQCVAGAQLAQSREPHRGQPFRLDRGHVPARTLDAEDFRLVAHQVSGRGLDRGVAAAVQNQRGIATQQTRCIDAQRNIMADPTFCVGIGHRFGIGFDVAALHRCATAITMQAKLL